MWRIWANGFAVGLWVTVSLGVAQGGAEPDCLTCHSAIKQKLDEPVVHAAVEMGCESCHLNHREPGLTAPKPYLNDQQPDLCLTCHDAEDSAIVTAHHGQPFAKARCTSCHDPHAAALPKLIPAEQHGPYGARQCEACHQPPKDGAVQLTAATTAALCFGCHEELKQRFEGAPHKHSLLAGDPNTCADCHDPHGSEHPYYLVKDAEQLCLDCHGEVIAGKKYVHEPVRRSCVLCHDPHAEANEKQLYAAGNDLCLECHGGNAAKIVRTSKPFALFGGRATLEPGTFENLAMLLLREGGTVGHPLASHPVKKPAEADKPAMNCLTCHLPHGAKMSRDLLVTDTAKVNDLCLRCH